uniref:Uncharacterized protein n=1 Tax=Meloidogyne enterolobii TaxID=390850 RepID=A0A6V7V7Z1_MELEN|nr:unnamed protein product [Meloidogyne enterolobii]
MKTVGDRALTLSSASESSQNQVWTKTEKLSKFENRKKKEKNLRVDTAQSMVQGKSGILDEYKVRNPPLTKIGKTTDLTAFWPLVIFSTLAKLY